MNKRTTRLLLDIVIAIILGSLLGSVVWISMPAIEGYVFALMLIPLIWLALRQGPSAAIVASLVVGLFIGFINWGFEGWINALLIDTVPLFATALAGIFAKYTQKTLNNRRFSSTYLNITTGSIISTVVYYLSRYWLLPLLLDVETPLQISTPNFWISVLVVSVLTAVVICLIARFLPGWIIPKRSKYLSRKETTSLLND